MTLSVKPPPNTGTNPFSIQPHRRLPEPEIKFHNMASEIKTHIMAESHPLTDIVAAAYEASHPKEGKPSLFRIMDLPLELREGI